MRRFFGPVQVGQHAYEPTCALIVGPFSCFCVSATPDYLWEEVVAPHAAQEKIPASLELKAPAEDEAVTPAPKAHRDDPVAPPPEEGQRRHEVKLREMSEPIPEKALGASGPRLLGVDLERMVASRCCSEDVSPSRALDELLSEGQAMLTRTVSEGGQAGRKSLATVVRRLSSIARGALFAKYGGDRSEREAEQFESELLEYLRDTHPPAVDRLAEMGWEDHCTKRYELYLKWLCGPPRIMLSVQTRTDRMVSCLPAVRAEGGLISGGLFPILCTVNSFPKWMPIVQSATLLKQLSPLRRIWHCSVRVGFFSFDFIVFVAVVDRLATAGRIDIILKSPEPDSEGQQWLGITVPPRECSIRMGLKAYGMSYTPISKEHGLVEAQMELSDKFPLKRLAVLLIKSANDKFLPQMEKVNSTFQGSGIDEILNAETKEAQQTRQALFRLSQSVDEYLARQEQLRSSEA